MPAGRHRYRGGPGWPDGGVQRFPANEHRERHRCLGQARRARCGAPVAQCQTGIPSRRGRESRARQGTAQRRSVGAVQLRDRNGQAREFNNYMVPVQLDGQTVFLAGVRDSNEPFRYLRIPADRRRAAWPTGCACAPRCRTVACAARQRAVLRRRRCPARTRPRCARNLPKAPCARSTCLQAPAVRRRTRRRAALPRWPPS